MCLIVFSYKQHPKYNLILAANRDELHIRPTATANFWVDYPNILAGRDLEKLGTWLGINKTGNFAAITNYRDPNFLSKNARTRGELVNNYLNTDKSPIDYLNEVDEKSHLYNGFNLLIGNDKSLYYYSNKSKEIIEISSGIYGLSNHLLNTPWPKVEQAKERLEDCLTKPEISVEALFSILAEEERPHDEYLPNTGVGLEKERLLAPIFIKNNTYGTRSSTILLIDSRNNVSFFEKSFTLHGKDDFQEASYNFTINKS